MLRTRLSRACLAALAVAALGGALLTSDIANASPNIDPGIGNGQGRVAPGGRVPTRVDPGFNRGPERIKPGFTKYEGGPKYAGSRSGDFQLLTKCRWIRTHNWRWRESVTRVCD